MTYTKSPVVIVIVMSIGYIGVYPTCVYKGYPRLHSTALLFREFNDGTEAADVSVS